MERKQNIFLIRPPTTTGINTYSSPAVMSIGVAYLTSYLKKYDFNVKVLDAVGEAIHQFQVDIESNVRTNGLEISEIVKRIPENTDLIGLSCMFTIEWPYNRKLIQEIKKAHPHIMIVLGGENVTSLWEEILNTTPEVDICVLGEGEETLLEIARNEYEDLSAVAGIAYRGKDEKPVSNVRRSRVLDFEQFPWPDWSDVPLENYFNHHGSWCSNLEEKRHIAVLATRGCPYQCTFCSSPSMWTTRFVVRKPIDLINELKLRVKENGITGFDMSDLTAILKRDWIFEFTNLLIESGMNLSWTLPQGTRTEQFDRELIRQLKKANLRFSSYCPESGSQKIVKEINKKINLNKMLNSMKIAKEEGLVLKTDFIIGFPFEYREDVFKTILFQFKCALVGVDDSIIHFYCPYPGSKIFNDLQEKGKIAYNEEYYSGLLNMVDLTNLSNYCENINKFELGFYRLFGMVLFYTTSYLRYPKRILRTIKVFLGMQKPVSLAELRVLEMIKKRFA